MNFEAITQQEHTQLPSNANRARLDLNRISRKLRRLVGQAISDYQMIAEGDRVMVCLSGGKDSYTMLETLLALQRSAPVEFSIIAVNVDQKHPGFPTHVLPKFLEERNVEYEIIEEDTYSIARELTPDGKIQCPICSRLRRGILYSAAERMNASKIALGHHADDVVETLFLNMFFGGTLKSMPPHLISDDGCNHVIRPLYYVRERLIEEYSTLVGHPIIPCNLCGSQEGLQRQEIKRTLRSWDKCFPGRVETIAKAIRNVKPSHLGDSNLFPFGNGSNPTMFLKSRPVDKRSSTT
ncbi:MAG: tRNA 2-thiocytidine(32) synthetase TtcA [Gammaproteobacteria bacterium]|nr:tRNA 2-thiocytidine(32) synthetase TtcA [Gammaproteobacteria bacterium]